MKAILKKYKFIFILIPLGLVISFLDLNVLDGFLADSEIKDHYLFLGILLVVIIALIFAVLKFDKSTEN